MSQCSSVVDWFRFHQHPIARIWRNIFFIILVLAILSMTPIGMIWMYPFFSVICMGFGVVGAGLCARVPGKTWRRHLCWALCIVFAIGMIVGCLVIDKNYYNRPEPNSIDAGKLLNDNQEILISAIRVIKPGEFFAEYKPEDAAPGEISEALRINGIESIERNKDTDIVRFTIRYPSYFEHDGDYRYLSYVPSDDPMDLLPIEFKQKQPLKAESSEKAWYYLIEDKEVWLKEWYAERMQPKWFYEANYLATKDSQPRLLDDPNML